MSKNTSIILGNHFESFIHAQITAGRYGSASEVVRAGLRLLEEHETYLKDLQTALEKGEQSGRGKRSMDEIFLAAKQRYENHG